MLDLGRNLMAALFFIGGLAGLIGAFVVVTGIVFGNGIGVAPGIYVIALGFSCVIMAYFGIFLHRIAETNEAILEKLKGE